MKFKKTSSEYNELSQYIYQNIDFSLPLGIKRDEDYFYVGQLDEKSNQRKGVGIQIEWNGNIFEGSWKNDKMNGQGRHISGNRGEGYYIGEFCDNAYEGQGEYTWPDRKKYQGQFVDGHYHGLGTFWWANGRKYVGQFDRGCRWGKGILYSKNGDIIDQRDWEDEEDVWKY